eukprot:2013158-Rhodomonas_salina.1
MVLRATTSVCTALRRLAIGSNFSGDTGVQLLVQAPTSYALAMPCPILGSPAPYTFDTPFPELGLLPPYEPATECPVLTSSSGFQAAAIVRCSSLEEVNMSNCQMSCGQVLDPRP